MWAFHEDHPRAKGVLVPYYPLCLETTAYNTSWCECSKWIWDYSLMTSFTKFAKQSGPVSRTAEMWCTMHVCVFSCSKVGMLDDHRHCLLFSCDLLSTGCSKHITIILSLTAAHCYSKGVVFTAHGPRQCQQSAAGACWTASNCRYYWHYKSR